jgi:hypothetical protein
MWTFWIYSKRELRRRKIFNYSDEHLIISMVNSLPPSWASQQLITIVKDEYIRRETEKHGIGAIPLQQVASSLGLIS